jgi:sec-independent protein translocase protein TatC
MNKYLLELKNRFILLVTTCVSVISISYFYKEILLFLIIEPDVLNNFNFTLQLDYFIFTDVLEVFSVYIQLILFLNLQILFLYFLYHCFVFLIPGLFFFEYKNLNLIFKIILIVWSISVLISKYFLIPITWNFFLSFQNLSSITLHFEAKLNEYLNFYISFYYLCILYSQVFTFLFICITYINTNISVIKKFRKLYYYFWVILSTFISPPDVLSQILISFVLIFLYELLIFGFIVKLFFYSLIRQPIKTDKNSYCK